MSTSVSRSSSGTPSSATPTHTSSTVHHDVKDVGKIAGIVVGSVVGGLLLIGLGLFCCCRSFLKKRKAKKAEKADHYDEPKSRVDHREPAAVPRYNYQPSAAHTGTKDMQGEYQHPGTQSMTGDTTGAAGNMSRNEGLYSQYTSGQGSGGIVNDARSAAQKIPGGGKYGVTNP